ncbi:MAG: DNA polymerase III subunit beta [Bacteroidales bacterium]|nr:DNA polymerase III subunit beta [Candidatus Minthousia equi]
MKFSVSSKALSAQLSALGRVVSSKNSLAILENFLFEISGNTLTLTASDSETTLTSSIEIIDSLEDGRFTISSKTMQEALKDIPEQPITFEVNASSLEMTIHYQNGKYNLFAQSADDYPLPVALNEEAVSMSIKSDILLNSVERTFFAASTDTLRPVMNGIFFDVTPDCVTLVATDGHKLVRCRNYNTQIGQNASFVLPKKPAQMLKNIFSKDGNDIEVSFDGRNAVFQSENVKMVCRLIEGRFPNYNAVIPKDNPYTITINRQGLLSALKRVLVFASEGAMLVKLTLSVNELMVSGQDVDFSTSAEEHLACAYSGVPMSIGFKGTFLIDILNNLSGDDVVIELADPSRPGVMVPAEQEGGEDVLMLLMPMMLND